MYYILALIGIISKYRGKEYFKGDKTEVDTPERVIKKVRNFFEQILYIRKK